MKAQMHTFSTWVEETKPSKLMDKMLSLLTVSGFTILNSTENHFEPQGYTSLILLGESHLAIHTFPEEKSTYIELVSCVKEPFDKFVKSMSE